MRAAWFRWTVGGVLVAVLIGSWFAMMRAAREALFFEPTTEALARAAEGRRSGILWGLVLVLAAVLLPLPTRRAGLALLAVPGVVTTVALALAPQAAAFLLGLVATATTLPLVLVVVALTGPRGARPPHP